VISQQLLNVISSVEIVTLREFAELRPCSLDVIENSSIVSRPHYSFDAFSTVHTKTLEKDRFARCDVLVEFYAHATKTRDCAIFGHRVHFDAFSTAYTNTICMRFGFDSLSRAFSNPCVFDANAQRIIVDGRPQRIEMYAFSNEDAFACVDHVPAIS